MLRRAAKVIARGIGAVVVLAMLMYAVLFVANLEDRPPSPDIALLKSFQELSSPVDRDGNAYLFLLGISAAPDTDPIVAGLERYQWMQIARPQFSTDDDPLADDYNFRGKRSQSVKELSTACGESEAKCAEALESDVETVRHWVSSEQWLLDRYRSLIRLTDYREAVPFELLAPMPSYGVASEAQRLLMMQSWLAASDGDVAAVIESLNQDLTFWRMVLAKSDALISKMVATAATIRHFKLGNLVLRRLSNTAAQDLLPASWLIPLTNEERSMARSLAGEWSYFDESIRAVTAGEDNPFDDWAGVFDATTWDRLVWFVLKPFWQHQDTSNRHAGLMVGLGRAFDVPYSQIPSATEVADQLAESAYQPYTALYNFTGNLIMGRDHWDFSPYAVRVSDLEGVRRAAVLAAQIRMKGIAGEAVRQHLATSDIVDPYTNGPLSWSASSNAIVFQGLEPNERSRHEFVH
ncbi:MAG: hypothetical protein QNJ14_12605 [Woeseiaceae bacterium]|nr:hypothetical protein [Woeseiaceae bacterium]